MKNSGRCPKCGSIDIVRVPDNPRRYTSGNNIYTTSITLIGKIPGYPLCLLPLRLCRELGGEGRGTGYY